MTLARRLRNAAAVSLALGLAGAANAQLVSGPVPFPTNCNDFFNNDFSVGSAFWPIDIETGEIGVTGAGVFTEFDSLSLITPFGPFGNTATFFTEGLAQGDHEFPLGSAANSTTFFRRQLLGAPSGNLQFVWGGQLSYVLIGIESQVEWNVTLVVTNIDTGDVAKCVLDSGIETVTTQPTDPVIQTTEEGVIFLGQTSPNRPFDLFNECKCKELRQIPIAGDNIEIKLIGTVRADSTDDGFTSAFIGGPIFYDNFFFCPINCIIADPSDPSDPSNSRSIDGNLESRQTIWSNFDMMPGESPINATDRILDADGDGDRDRDDLIRRASDAQRLLHELRSDLDRDGVTDADDLTRVLSGFGSDGDADVNGDGVVDARDLVEVLERIDGDSLADAG